MKSYLSALARHFGGETVPQEVAVSRGINGL
jgi:hypothetical protein